MKKCLVMRRAIGEEVQQISDALTGNLSVNMTRMAHRNSAYFDVMLEVIPSWIRFAKLCTEKEMTYWGALIDSNKVTLPSGEIINFDEQGKIIEVQLEDRLVPAADFWENATSVVSDNNCKIIHDNITTPHGEITNVTLVCWSPVLTNIKTSAKIGQLAYEDFLVIIGTSNDFEDIGMDDIQMFYEFAVGDLLAKNQSEIELLTVTTLENVLCDDDEDEETDSEIE